MSHTEDIKFTLAKMRAIHEEQTRRLIEQIAALRQITVQELRNEVDKPEETLEKETVSVWTEFLKNLK